MAAATENTYILQEMEENVPMAKGKASGNGKRRSSGAITPQSHYEEEESIIEDSLLKDSGSSLSSTAFNFINSIIGSGIIGMPYAVKESGVLLGLFSLFLVAWMTDYSLVLMVKGGELSETYSYQEMIGVAFGKPGYIILTIMQFIYPIIAMISYNVIVGDTVTRVIDRVSGVSPEDTWWVQRETIIIATTLIITLPLSLYRNVGKLAKASLVALVCTFFTIGVILYRADSFRGKIPSAEQDWDLFKLETFPQAIAIMACAFMCHHNSFLLYKSLESPTIQRWNKVTHISLATSLFLILIFSVAGYATFQGLTQGDLLNNYCWSDDLMNVTRLIFCFIVLLTFPMECFVVREVTENVFFGPGKEVTGTRAYLVHVFITVVVVAGVCAASIVTECLGIVLELNGILTAIPLAYILPAACYLKLSPGSLLSSEKLAALFILAFGTVVCVIGCVTVALKGTGNCVQDHQMPYCLDTNYTHAIAM